MTSTHEQRTRPYCLWGLYTPLVALCTACAPYHVYWGDVHGHTELSDGRGSVADYLDYARNVADLDFVIVTDHDFGHGPPWRMPAETWQQIQATVDAYSVNGTFIAIAGYEWTSAPKYWSDYTPAAESEHLFAGAPMYYNHKNVYFPARGAQLFSAKDAGSRTPDQLATAVQACGGLIQNNHPSAGPEGRDQWAYDPHCGNTITNTEIGPDRATYDGHEYVLDTEQTVRAFLNRGGRTGFVAGSDTHEGHPAARTAVLAGALTRAAIFDALRHRRNYAVSGGRIVLDFRINGHLMGEGISVAGPPRLNVVARGTAPIAEIVIIRDGEVVHAVRPGTKAVDCEFTDSNFAGQSYYYVRVTQSDRDKHGNPSRAWSSPIWVHTVGYRRPESAGAPPNSPGHAAHKDGRLQDASGKTG